MVKGFFDRHRNCLMLATWRDDIRPASRQRLRDSDDERVHLSHQRHADEEMDGLLRWETELQSCGIAAMIKASGPVLETYPQLFKRLAQDAHEIIGGLAYPLCILLTRT